MDTSDAKQVPAQIALTREQMLLLLSLLMFIVLCASPGSSESKAIMWRRIDAGHHPFDRDKVWAMLDHWLDTPETLKRATRGKRLQEMALLVRGEAEQDLFLFDDFWARVDAMMPSLPSVYPDFAAARRCIRCIEMHLTEPHGELATGDRIAQLLYVDPDLGTRAPEQPGPVASGRWHASPDSRNTPE